MIQLIFVFPLLILFILLSVLSIKGNKSIDVETSKKERANKKK